MALAWDVSTELRSLPDAELARQTRAGFLPAFEELVFRYEGRIFRFLLHSCGNEADAREVTQDTFVRAFRAIARFDPRYSFAGWLFTIARRKRIDRLRAAPPAANEPMPELTAPDDPAQLLACQEERQNLWRLAGQSLPQLQFQTLWLRYAEDLSVEQIARSLHKTQTHIKVLLFRARLTLGRQLKAASASGPRGAPRASRPDARRAPATVAVTAASHNHPELVRLRVPASAHQTSLFTHHI